MNAGGRAQHGMTHSDVFGIWVRMRQRCKKDRHYAGRGIAVCGRWLGPQGFVNFYADMGPRPSAAHSIDRIDNDGPYSSENCRWATRAEQNRNKSNNVWIEHGGERRVLTDWAQRLGIPLATLQDRHERGLRGADVFSPPPRRRDSGTHCKHGHERTPQNTYISPRYGTKLCRVCWRYSNARSYAKRAAKNRGDK